MAKFKDPLHAKIEVRRSHPALKAAVAVLILFSTAALVALGWVHRAIREETEALRGEAAAVENANSNLEDRIADPDSIENIRDVARDELGLVDPDTVVIDPN